MILYIGKKDLVPNHIYCDYGNEDFVFLGTSAMNNCKYLVFMRLTDINNYPQNYTLEDIIREECSKPKNKILASKAMRKNLVREVGTLNKNILTGKIENFNFIN